MVYVAMEQVIHHRFDGGQLNGTLADSGVGLAKFYTLRSRIPRSVRAEIPRITKGIENGTIPVDPRLSLRMIRLATADDVEEATRYSAPFAV